MQRLAILFVLAAAVPAAAQQPSADSARVYELSEVEVLPRPRNAADFAAALREAYPPHLRTAGVGGTVQVGFVVGPDGVPADVRVLATPDSGFNAPTVRAVSLLRFTPAQAGGRAVAARVEQPVTWRADAPMEYTGGNGGTILFGRGDSVNGYELGEVEDLPRPVDAPAFSEALMQAYPQDLRAGRISGTVHVRLRVEEDGTTSNHEITRSTDRQFNAPTLRAIRVLRFRPARIGGRPVKVWVTQPVQWTPDGQQPVKSAPGRGRRPRG